MYEQVYHLIKKNFLQTTMKKVAEETMKKVAEETSLSMLDKFAALQSHIDL